jgi:hypothetical protein
MDFLCITPMVTVIQTTQKVRLHNSPLAFSSKKGTDQAAATVLVADMTGPLSKIMNLLKARVILMSATEDSVSLLNFLKAHMPIFLQRRGL